MEYTQAKFWKCALQVNPAGYITNRGQEQTLSEADYNQQMLDVCLQEKIKVLGIADHGNVDGVDAIRNLMNANDILVFPGFEISSSEQIHFVCLFSQETSSQQLERYLGNLKLLDPSDGVRPTNLSAEQLIAEVNKIGGFIYAAHCTSKNGLLKGRWTYTWQLSGLKAAQIPGSVEDLNGVDDDFYRKVIRNKERAYKRELPVAIINAKDIETPETLKEPSASCLIKMTKPSFESFKLAFQDPESRVRLNSDVEEKYYSQITSLKVTGGYLDGIYIEFSEHLNAVIGGRGTGKSTLLECIRYVLELEPIGINAQKQHKEIIKENLGKSKARVELTIRSSKMNGKKFTIARRYGENVSVKDENDNSSPFTPADLMPEIELYGQNEIYEIAQDAVSQRKLLARFLEGGQSDSEGKIKETLKLLSENRLKLAKALNNIALTEDELASLPKLEEQVNQFKSLGLEDKLKIIPLLETEKRLLIRTESDELNSLEQAFLAIHDVLPDTVFLSDKALENLPHATALEKIKIELDKLKLNTDAILKQWQGNFSTSKTVINGLIDELKGGIKAEEEKLEKTYKELPSSEGKSGREIGLEFQKLMQDIERIKPKQALAITQQAITNELELTRKKLLVELSEFQAARSAQFERSLKKLNKKLNGKLKLTVKPEADRTPIIEFLTKCHLEGVGEGRLRWVLTQDDFSTVKLAELIRSGADALIECGWGITLTVANALVRLSSTQILQIEELELPDDIHIELNVAHEGADNFRLLDKLSTGQQCTAILHLLLLQNKDPLIMDQPEDNLDNAFIADRIVAELRMAKISRQFIFATHNANIPVFGDAEWIGVFDLFDGQATMLNESQGAIDVPRVRDKAASILEGGKTAFNQRKVKYGY